MQIQFSTVSSVDGNDSDSDLIASALAGNQASYTKLVDRYQGRLTSAIRTKVACSGIADDIVQDAFVRAFNSLHSFRSDSGFYTWLYRIGINTAKNHLVALGKRPKAMDEVEIEDIENFEAGNEMRNYDTPENTMMNKEIV